jgi:hypothetical protein
MGGNQMMKFSKSIYKSFGHKSTGHKSIWFLLLAGLLLAGVASAQGSRQSPWGREQNGLRMAIYPSSPPGVRSPGSRFIVAFQNMGKTDLALNLGVSLANGRTQYPDKVVLVVADPNGPHTLTLRKPGVKGSASPFIVSLAAGSTTSFSVNLEDYWAAPSGNFDTKLKPGYPYTIEGSFAGQAMAAPIPASATNAGPAYLWTGYVKSKRFHFTVGAAYGPYPRYAPYAYPPNGPYPYPPPYGRPYPPPPPPPPPQDPYGYGPPPNRGQQQPPPDNGQNGAQSQSQSPSGDDQAAPQDDGQPPQQDNGSPSSPPNGPPPSQ